MHGLFKNASRTVVVVDIGLLSSLFFKPHGWRMPQSINAALHRQSVVIFHEQNLDATQSINTYSKTDVVIVH